MKKTVFTFLLTCCCLFNSFCQPGISGNVSDLKKAPVRDATVHILNTEISRLTDAKGNFSIQNLQPGKYILLISAVGYSSINTLVDISKNANLNLSFQLTEDFKQLDAVIVNAEKKETNLQAVPSSLTSLSEKNIADYRIWTAEEQTAIIPNLYSANPGDGRNVSSVRGIVSASYDPAVTTIIDGVTQFTLDTYIPQLFDVFSIEVLRGPQGTLYGRNAMGGIINITTKQPGNKTKLFAEINAGNYGTQRYTAGIKTPVIKNKLFIGAAGIYSGLSGYYKNDFNNLKFDRQYSAGGNYYLKYLISSKWNAAVNVKHLSGVNRGAFPLASSPQEAFSNPYMVNQDALSKMIDKTFNGSFSLNYTGNYFNFSSQSAYQSNYRYYTVPLDGDFSPIDGITIINNYGKKRNKVKVLTQEFKITSPATLNSKWQWLAGAYFFYQKSPAKQATHFGKDALLVGSPDIDYSIINTSRIINKGAAAYGQVIYTLTEKLTIKIGLRYDYQHSKASVLGEYKPDASPVPVFQTQPDTSANTSFSAVSPAVSIMYQLQKNNTLYALYSRGFRSGGLTQLSPDPSQPPLYAYQPEYSSNFEIGSKNLFFHNKLRINAAVFYTVINNAQVPTLILPEAITITKNAGKLTSKGFEAELNATVLKGLEAVYTIGVTDAVYKKLKTPANGQTVDLEGNRQVFSPGITSLTAWQYTWPLNKLQTIKLIVRGEWVYLGRQYFNLANTIRQSPYSLINTRFGISTKHFQLLFWGRNIFNKKYIAYAYDFGATHLGNPSTYGFTIRIDK
jgi:iron complex outermembrane recepter protein